MLQNEGLQSPKILAGSKLRKLSRNVLPFMKREGWVKEKNWMPKGQSWVPCMNYIQKWILNQGTTTIFLSKFQNFMDQGFPSASLWIGLFHRGYPKPDPILYIGYGSGRGQVSLQLHRFRGICTWEAVLKELHLRSFNCTWNQFGWDSGLRADIVMGQVFWGLWEWVENILHVGTSVAYL